MIIRYLISVLLFTISTSCLAAGSSTIRYIAIKNEDYDGAASRAAVFQVDNGSNAFLNGASEPPLLFHGGRFVAATFIPDTTNITAELVPPVTWQFDGGKVMGVACPDGESTAHCFNGMYTDDYVEVEKNGRAVVIKKLPNSGGEDSKNMGRFVLSPDTVNELVNRDGKTIKVTVTDSNQQQWLVTQTLSKVGTLSLKKADKIYFHIDLLNRNAISSGASDTARRCIFTGGVDGVDGYRCNVLLYSYTGTRNTGSLQDNLKLTVVNETNMANAGMHYRFSHSEGNSAWERLTDSIDVKKINGLIGGDLWGQVQLFMPFSFIRRIFLEENKGKLDKILTFCLESDATLNLIEPFCFRVGTGIIVDSSDVSVRIVPAFPGSSKGAKGDRGFDRGHIGGAAIEIPFYIFYNSRDPAMEVKVAITQDISSPIVRGIESDYCKFITVDGDPGDFVPVPGEFVVGRYNSDKKVKFTHACKGEEFFLPIDEGDMGSRTTWIKQDIGGRYQVYEWQTYARLLFPMNNPVSLKTHLGKEWNGIAQAEGEIKVSVRWGE